MYAVVRSYSGPGASELFDLLGQREEDVKNLIGAVPGFVSYVAFRSGDGGTITLLPIEFGYGPTLLIAIHAVHAG